jgi:putative transposase
MLWSIRYRLLCSLLRVLVRCGLDELDLETVVLHHQLKVLRRGGRRVLFTTADRAFLAAAGRVLSRRRWKSFLVGPDTLARWHPNLVKGRSGRGSRPPGRPPLDPSIKRLIRRLGRENPRWGYLRIRGELLKLGIDVSATTIATVLRESGLGPAPRRIGPTWTQFPRLQAYDLLSPGFPGAPSEKDSLKDLPSGHGAMSEDPGTAETDEPIHDDPSAPSSAAVQPRPRVPQRTASPRDGARARDGPAIAA